MAGGGLFTSYNKVLPGAYINFISKARANTQISERGVVAIAFANSWGEEGKIVSITAEDFETDALKIFGYSYSSDVLLPIREIFKNATELKLFRLGGGEKASIAIESLNVLAKYAGIRGNDIKIKVSKDVSTEDFTVYTYIEETLVDEQTVANINELVENDFVTFSGEGTLSSNAGVNLTNGTDTTVKNEQYSIFLSLIEAESFNVLAYDGEDDTTKGLFCSFTKRLRDEEGVKFISVLYDYTKADYEGVVSLKNSKEFIYWLAGALAGAEVNESITNKTYDGEYELEEKYTNSELKEAIQNGEIAFYYDNTNVKVLKDINTFTSFTSEKNSDFSNNQVIRILDTTANDIAVIFNDYYLGKMQNDTLGRDIFKSEVIEYFNSLQSIRAIDNFEEDNISVSKGSEKGDVILDVLIEPAAAMDKLYMKCVIE